MAIVLKTAQFFALLLTGLSAGVAFAHLLELPNKMVLSAQDYLVVQQHIYNGFGRVVGPIETFALFAALIVGVLVRKRRIPFLLTLFAIICLAASLLVWQLHNGPVNQAVDSWTAATMPLDWMIYRNRWEYAHATRAGLYTISLSMFILSILIDTRISQRTHSLSRKVHHL